ncbi:MAG: hypothetical protein EA375_02225 [Acholeplasmataceae bacterium]|nr:MAG: hypothetical protein EA375_02225 [Acholeplasmataceae bacterium]
MRIIFGFSFRHHGYPLAKDLKSFHKEKKDGLKTVFFVSNMPLYKHKTTRNQSARVTGEASRPASRYAINRHHHVSTCEMRCTGKSPRVLDGEICLKNFGLKVLEAAVIP